MKTGINPINNFRTLRQQRIQKCGVMLQEKEASIDLIKLKTNCSALIQVFTGKKPYPNPLQKFDMQQDEFILRCKKTSERLNSSKA